MNNVMPAGWYPDQSGDLRYWDGAGWTVHVQHAAATPPPVPEAAPTPFPQQPMPVVVPTSPSVMGQPSSSVAPVVAVGLHQHQGPPYGNLRTDRSLLTFVLLSLITFGLYGVWLIASSGEDLNTIAGRRDNRRTMNYWLLFFIVGPVTLGIADFVWWHRTSDRIRNESQRRGLTPLVEVSDFWLWCVLGTLIVIGPFVFMHKWLRGMNQISAHSNQYG